VGDATPLGEIPTPEVKRGGEAKGDPGVIGASSPDYWGGNNNR